MLLAVCSRKPRPSDWIRLHFLLTQKIDVVPREDGGARHATGVSELSSNPVTGQKITDADLMVCIGYKRKG